MKWCPDALVALLVFGGASGCCAGTSVFMGDSGLFSFSAGPLLGGLPAGSRAAVVLFQVSWVLFDEDARARASALFGPFPAAEADAPPEPIEQPAAVYAAFRLGLQSGGVGLAADDRVRALPDLAALVPALREPSPSSPAPWADARAFPFPLEVGDEVRVERASTDPFRAGAGPMKLLSPRDFLSDELSPVSPRMGRMAAELGAEGLIEAALVPIRQLVRDGHGHIQGTSTRVFAMVAIFGPDGRRRFENIFVSKPIDPHGTSYDDSVQARAVEFARQLGARVAREAFSG